MRIPITKCSTPACPSTEVEAVNIGPPETVPMEPDLLQYQYEGHCPLCKCALFGCFWAKFQRTILETK